MSILTVNTNGVKLNGHGLIQHLLMKYSLSCIQESKFRDPSHWSTFCFHLEQTFRHKVFVSDRGCSSRSTRRQAGVVTVLRSDFPGFDSAVEVPEWTVENRYLVVKLMVNDAPVFVHNVYAPVDCGEKTDFFAGLPTGTFPPDSTHVVCGDLNTPLDLQLDASRRDSTADTGRASCLAWLGCLGVVDPWRIHHPAAQVFTGPVPRYNRLDYILASEPFANALFQSAEYFAPKSAGDHLAHSITLRSSQQLHGRGYWKFPAYLLEYPDVVEAIRTEATMVLTALQDASNPGSVWEHWKKTIRRKLQQVQAMLRRQDTQDVEKARSLLDKAASRFRLERDHASRDLFSTALDNYRACVSRASCYNQDSRFDHHAQRAERSTKFFFRPLDTSVRRVSIEQVRLPGGDTSSSPHAISLGFLRHWGSVMGDPGIAGPTASTDQRSQSRLLHSVTTRLDEVERLALNEDISPEDLTMALKHMRASSAPGMDGLTAGFYQVAPDTFGECLSIVFNYQLQCGMLLPSQRKSAICLLHKKGSRAEPSNYRPIALMQVDVKALSKVLTFRLQRCISKLIHQDQKAFVKGRSLHHHVRYLSDLQNLCTERDETAFAMFLDFEKAYDRVDWDFMFKILHKMGCGSSFVDWVRLLYCQPQAHLLINGQIQDALQPTRGVKQGDPLSALLFLLVIEPLGNLLREHEEYGICLNDEHTATGMFFADDSTLLAGSVANVHAQLELVNCYCLGSGAKLNLAKSILMPLNRRLPVPSNCGLPVLEFGTSTKFLGLPIGQHDTTDELLGFLDQRYYDGFRQWYGRARTFRGRLLVAQTMVLSRLWHYTVHVDVPKAQVQRWQSLLNRFALSRSYERDARSIQLIHSDFLHGPRSTGGLQIPVIQERLKKQRLQLLLQYMRTLLRPTVRSWGTATMELHKTSLPRFGPISPTDILFYHPNRHGTMIQWSVATSWWKTTLLWWQEAPWDLRWPDLPPGDRVKYLLRQPLWLNTDDLLHYEQTRRATTSIANKRALGRVSEPQRSFRQHVANTFGLRSLADFQTADGSWPCLDAFVAAHVDYTFIAVPVFTQSRWLQRLHIEATQVYERIVRASGHNPDGRSSGDADSPVLPVFGMRDGSRVWYGPTLPRKLLKALGPAPRSTRPHPVKHHDPRASQSTIQHVVALSHRLRRILLPVFEDLQWRLAFRLLPVRSRFWFLEAQRPNATMCVQPNCGETETEKHLFFECGVAKQVWECALRDWAPFFSRSPPWPSIALGKPPALRPAWRSAQPVVYDIWHVFRAVVLRFLWIDRNRCMFDDRLATPALPAMAIIYTTVCAHVRHLQRRVYEEDEQQSLASVLAQLHQSSSFGGFVQAHPGINRVRYRP